MQLSVVQPPVTSILPFGSKVAVWKSLTVAMLPVEFQVPGRKVAVMVVFAVMDTVHVPVPVQPPPDQPENVEPASGVAVRVTEVPLV